MSIKQWLNDEFFTIFGVPARLKRLLTTHPEICVSANKNTRTIDHDSVVRGDKFGSDVRSVYRRRRARLLRISVKVDI